MPPIYETKQNRVYESMIYTLVYKYGKTKEEAGKMTAYDYAFILALENLNVQREKYLFDKK